VNDKESEAKIIYLQNKRLEELDKALKDPANAAKHYKAAEGWEHLAKFREYLTAQMGDIERKIAKLFTRR
jgi:hypothetical protein